jgi:hypothetical protein
VIAADRGYVLFMGLLPLVLGMLIRLVPAKQGLAGPPGNTSAQDRPLPAHGAFLHGLPLLELLIAVAMLAVASMCLGLLVSAFVTTSEKAMPFLVMLTMIQIVLSGGVLSLAGMNGLAQLSWIAPASARAAAAEPPRGTKNRGSG